jgi:hypothetical protein
LPSYAVPSGPVGYRVYAAPPPVLSVSVGWSQYSAQRPSSGWRTAPGYANAGPPTAAGWSVHASYSSGGAWGAPAARPSGYGYGYGGRVAASAGWSASASRSYPARSYGYGSYRSMTGGRTFSRASFRAVARR